MAISLEKATKSGLRATKSVSQLTSTITPMREPCRYCATVPSAAMRVAFLAAEAIPFLRRYSIAFSMSAVHSVSAFLQSAMPAPVRSRRSLIIWAVTSEAMTWVSSLVRGARSEEKVRKKSVSA